MEGGGGVGATDSNEFSHMETCPDISRTKESPPEDTTLALRKDQRAISLGGGLNRLAQGLDQPDGDFPAEQPSFLHSKYAPPQQSQSSYCLVDREEEEQRKKEKEKKRTNRLSKGIMEFINMGESLGYADKKLKPFVTLPSDEGSINTKSQSMAELSYRRHKDKKSLALSNDNTGSSNNGDHSDRSVNEHSPPVLRARRAKSRDKRRTQELTQSDKDKLKVLEPVSRPRSRKSSPAPQPGQQVPVLPSAPSLETPPLPSGRTMLEVETCLDIDQLFSNMFSDCKFYRDWLFDPRRQVDTKNLSTTNWIRNETSGLLERDVFYDRFQDFVITSATIKVAQKHTQQGWSRPGVVYGVDQRITNKGAPYADSFVITEHYRLTTTKPGWCRLVIISNVDFLKYSFVKGKIESETWAGLSKSYEILKETLEKNNNNTDQRDITSRDAKEEATDSKVSRMDHEDRAGESPTRIRLYPENYQYTGQLILMIILLILTMLVISLFKLANTLEKIEQRLSSIEHIFQMR